MEYSLSYTHMGKRHDRGIKEKRMANPTTNFGWVMPAATDLVTDLPADFEVFGQAVDTDFVYLLGGTTGQVLAKASGTDLDFVWSADAAGMTNPMTTTGDVIYSSSGSTPARLGIGTDGQVLTSDGSIVNWETPSADIPLSTVTTNGDVIYATGSGAVTRLGIGSTSDVLTVAGGVPTWAAPAGGGGMTSIASGTFSGTALTISSISGSYKHLYLAMAGITWSTGNDTPALRLNGITSSDYDWACFGASGATFGSSNGNATEAYPNTGLDWLRTGGENQLNYFIPNYSTANSIAQYTASASYLNSSSVRTNVNVVGSLSGVAAAITSITIRVTGKTFTAGNYTLYGVN